MPAEDILRIEYGWSRQQNVVDDDDDDDDDDNLSPVLTVLYTACRLAQFSMTRFPFLLPESYVCS